MDPSMVPDADARASDAEREDTVERLRDAAGEGRLNLDELADRAGAAYSATTRSELALLVEDLPSITTPQADRASLALKPRTFYGILGGDKLGGALRLGGGCRVINVLGGVDLDLTQVTLEDGMPTIHIISVLGGSTIRIPHGVQLERSGVSILGGDSVEPDMDGAPPPGAPVVRLRVFNLLGGNTIKRGARREIRWPWRRTIDQPARGALEDQPKGR
ncbi:MAG TPA: DUF1707 domain-containing protein [Solirubrobacteraceae bacterium]|nr:DUF1707 domain-containing protein [Solirubrobacteraceae bacterium]